MENLKWDSSVSKVIGCRLDVYEISNFYNKQGYLFFTAFYEKSLRAHPTLYFYCFPIDAVQSQNLSRIKNYSPPFIHTCPILFII